MGSHAWVFTELRHNLASKMSWTWRGFWRDDPVFRFKNESFFQTGRHKESKMIKSLDVFNLIIMRVKKIMKMVNLKPVSAQLKPIQAAIIIDHTKNITFLNRILPSRTTILPS